MMNQELLTPKQVSEWLGLTEGALAQMRYLGKGPAYIKLSARHVRYHREAVEAWLTSRDQIATSRESR